MKLREREREREGARGEGEQRGKSKSPPRSRSRPPPPPPDRANYVITMIVNAGRAPCINRVVASIYLPRASNRHNNNNGHLFLSYYNNSGDVRVREITRNRAGNRSICRPISLSGRTLDGPTTI